MSNVIPFRKTKQDKLELLEEFRAWRTAPRCFLWAIRGVELIRELKEEVETNEFNQLLKDYERILDKVLVEYTGPPL